MTNLDQPDAAAIVRFVVDNLQGVDLVEADGDTYFFYDPQRDTPVDHRFPFATLVTGDRHDQFSNLDRPSVYRLNVGVQKETFQSLFGKKDEIDAESFDYTAFDRIMPHPVYGDQYWVCVLNPTPETLEKVLDFLKEAHAFAAKMYDRRAQSAPKT